MPVNILAPKVPSVSKAARNALAIRNQEFSGKIAKTQLAGAETQNLLARKKLGSYDADQAASEKSQHYQTQARAITAALSSPDPTQATNIFKSLGGDPNTSITFEGDQVEMDYGKHTIKGSRNVVSEMFTKIGEDPKWAENPETWAWFSARGGSMDKKKAEDESTGTWGQSKEGIDGDGNPIKYVTNKEGQLKILSGVQPSPKKGMKVYDSNGNLIVDMGGGGDIQKKTMGDLEKKIINANEGLIRVSNIVKAFKPEYQEIPKRLGVAWTDIKAKMGVDISDNDKQELEDFSVYKQDSLENINLYIKEITGAQMSEKEANRLRKAQPDPGDGIFGGDSPPEFKAKLVNQYKKLKASSARYNYYLSKGIDETTLNNMINKGEVISLDKMNGIINQRGKELEKEIKEQNPDIDTQTLIGQIRSRLSQEFGGL